MRISVRFFTVLREIAGKKEETIEFPPDTKVTLKSFLQTLQHLYGKPFTDYICETETSEVKGFLQFFINGNSATAMKGLESELYDGDVLAIVPPVGGG